MYSQYHTDKTFVSNLVKSFISDYSIRPDMANSRFRAVEKALEKEPVKTAPPASGVSEYYGCDVFGRRNMRKYLSPDTRRSVYESAESGKTLDASTAELVAEGMKRWATDLGATHYSHWFQPLTGGTAEKHDSFATPHGHGEAIETFSGAMLCQQEPDASSFPSGGLRNTFEARGYTAWDPSSPAFVIGDTLFIPTVFISYNGEALDYKTPLLRSIAAVSRAASEVLEYFGIRGARVESYLGWEQEFFLADSSLSSQRPDIMLAGRTLVGHESAKSQQLDDHYFGSIPMRVLEFMKDLEFECYKLGIPIKTRHNEVAPNQFEIAPVYEEANLAVDHNLMLMSLMRPTAKRHGFRVLFHEKPYKGVNGSGKHCNWSLGISDGPGLFSPGKTNLENLRFLTFVVNVLAAVRRHDSLLKASVMNASNVERLGADEAPPAIISVFLGTSLTEVFEKLLSSEEMVEIGGNSGYRLGLPRIPEITVDGTDRNRTSPFAFTGNRFEFRAVGASASCSPSVTVINAAVAEQLKEFKKKVDARIASGVPAEKAVLDEVRETYASCRDVCFEGNAYSEEWKAEAKRRNLDCEESVPIVYDSFTSPESLELFSDTGILTETEAEARTEILWEQYGKKVEIEARTLSDMTLNHILPVATAYQSLLLDNVSKIKESFSESEFKVLAANEIELVRAIAGHISEARRLSMEIDSACDRASEISEEREKAIAFHDGVVPLMSEIRTHADSLEMIVDDQMWPLPKYRELLFIH
jgi:glutamine synthetase